MHKDVPARCARISWRADHDAPRRRDRRGRPQRPRRRRLPRPCRALRPRARAARARGRRRRVRAAVARDLGLAVELRRRAISSYTPRPEGGGGLLVRTDAAPNDAWREFYAMTA